jgi:hypothetical protein
MSTQTENLTAGQSPITKEEPSVANQQSQITNQKSPMPKKATGPRTAEGKRRVSQNARKHGLFANASFYWDAAITLGEDPREFERLLKGLVRARQPADTLEMVLVEDIALLIRKKVRLDRQEVAVQVRNLQKHDLERRKLYVQVGREISDTAQSEVREKGLRRTLDAPGKFEQVLSILNMLVEMVEKNEFTFNMQEFLRALYGTEPTLRGAGLYNNYFKLSQMKPGNQEFQDAKTLMKARLAEEISDIVQQYELFLHEYVENTRAARVAATAPSHAQWAAIIRQQNALHRQLERKIRLLDEIQEKRKRQEERFLDNYQASLRRNPSDAPRGGGPHGGGHGPNRKKPLGQTSHASRSAASRRRESLRAANLEEPQTCAARSSRRNPSHAPRGGCASGLSKSAAYASVQCGSVRQSKKDTKSREQTGGFIENKGVNRYAPLKTNSFLWRRTGDQSEKNGVSTRIPKLERPAILSASADGRRGARTDQIARFRGGQGTVRELTDPPTACRGRACPTLRMKI